MGKTQVAECNFLNTGWIKVSSMTLTSIGKIKLFSKANIDPTIMVFPCYMFMFSLKIDSLVSCFSKKQSITLGKEINFNYVSELRKDLNLVGEKIFSSFDY